jgi:hypothetical protein
LLLDSVGKERMNFKHVLIVTYGRSGSTLLQGLLNSIDGCIVKGENYNACYGLFKTFQSVENTYLNFGDNDKSLSPTSPWFGADELSLERFLEDARRLLINQLSPQDAGYKCLGFKEIRYFDEVFNRSGDKSLHAYLNFLTTLLPDCALVFLKRDHDEVTNSAWWKNQDSNKLKQRLAAFDESLKSYAQNKSWVFPIDYSDMTQRTSRLKELFSFLGAEYQEEKVEAALTTRHSYTPSKGADEEADAGKTRCRLDILDNPKVSHIEFDRLVQNESIELGKPLSLRGVVVLNADVQGEYQLVAVDENGENIAEWGLLSPKMKKTYPDNPNAVNARFKFKKLLLTRHQKVDIYLSDSSNNRQELANISVL